MPFLRAPYWRRQWVSSGYIPYNPSLVSTGLSTQDDLRLTQGSVTQYYQDESPSNVTVYDEVPLSLTTDGTLYVSWTDNTGGLRHHRLSFRERFSSSSQSWYVAAQYDPSRTTGEINGLTQAQGYDVGVQSIDTADNFLSQRTYVIHTLSFQA